MTNTAGEGTLPPHFRHNFIAFLTDYVFFGVAFSFVNLSTVLPAFVHELTDSEPLIGMINTVFSAGWLLPQMGVAALMSRRPRRKPYLIASIYAGRPLFLLLAVVTWARLTDYPTAMLTVLFLSLGLFTVLDGIASVAWFDILARAIPLDRRARLIGSGQLLSNSLGILAGLLVERVLQSAALPFPNNYALLFALSAAAHVPSVIALTLIREPLAEGEADREPLPLRHVLRQLGQVWGSDRDFRLLMGVRWLAGLMGLASSFYTLHATQVMGLPEGINGRFVSAQMIGGVIGGIGLGWLGTRRGPRPVILLSCITALASPLLALAIHLTGQAALPLTYLLVYVFLGVYNGSLMTGHFNYLLEIAPPDQRALYVGLSNTLAGVLMPVSFLGGVLLRATSYPLLFAITAGGVSLGLLASLRLRDLRQEPGG